MIEEARADLLERGGWKLEEFIEWHLMNGWLISAPYCFGGGYFYEENGRTICAVSYVRGDWKLLIRFCLNYAVDILEFERKFSDKTRRIKFEKIAKRILYG